MRSLTPKNSLIVVGIGIALVVAFAGCSAAPSTTAPNTSDDTATPAAGLTIAEKGLAFTPADANVKVGDTVTFVNEDTAPHNVSIDGTELGTQNQGDTVKWTATKAGSFPFSCVIHPTMTGQITVK